ncbi:MAG: serine/threonine protein kinase [Gemmataceae bacterium]
MGFLSNLFGMGSKGLKTANLNKRWDLRGRTGQGSMSRVFQAYDKELGRTVALKLLDKEKTKRFEARFTAMGLKKPPEGEICVGLKHENIVRTFEHGITTDGEPYLVLEWIEGLGLNYLIETRNAQLNTNRVNYLGQLCDALQYLHDTKYLHRDLCPRNIMVNSEGVLKLIDFGLTIPYTTQFCQPGNRTGTSDYLPPELIKRKQTDHRVDMFALGVTAYEVFTHNLPWERTASSEENLRRRLNIPPRSPQELHPGHVGDDLQKLLLKSVSKEPTERYGTPREFKEALQGLKKSAEY